MNLSFPVYILIVTFLISVLTRRWYPETHFRMFSWFLLLIIAVEICGNLLRNQKLNNTWLYNFYSLISFVFFLWFYSRLLKGLVTRSRVRIAIGVVVLVCLVDLLFVQGLYTFNTYSYIAGNLVVDACGILLLYQRFKHPDDETLQRQPEFWIAISITFFYICSLSFIGVANYAASLPRAVTRQLATVFKVIAALYYILFIIAFICRIPTRKSTSNS